MQIFYSAHRVGHWSGQTTCHRRLVRSRDLPAHEDNILAAPWQGGHIWTVASGFANRAAGALANFEGRETTAA